jgi:hypothetical protein
MPTVGVDIPEEVLTLLRDSRLGDRPIGEQVRVALAIHLFQEGVISGGKAAAIAGESRATFELLLGEVSPGSGAWTSSSNCSRRFFVDGIQRALLPVRLRDVHSPPRRRR